MNTIMVNNMVTTIIMNIIATVAVMMIMVTTIVMQRLFRRINGCHTLMNQGYLMNMV